MTRTPPNLPSIGSSIVALGLLGACPGDQPMSTETMGDEFACGDGVVEGEEACDDGNAEDGDGCSATCRQEVCGDGLVVPAEACDDGAETATCDADCTASVCGDGHVNALAGEQCDDGNAADDDACGNDCRLPVCGDGAVEGDESCDNASGLCSDACAALCGDGTTPATCGTHLWARRFGAVGEQISDAVAVDGAGHIVVTGAYDGTADFGGNDLLVAKFSADGDNLWSRHFGDEWEQRGRAVAVDGAGNVIVTGDFDGTMNLGGDDLVSQGFTDLFVAKFSPAGEHLWSRSFGDADFQIGHAVAVDSQGNVVITGNLWGAMNLGGDDLVSQGLDDLFMAKFSPAGEHVWSRRFGDADYQHASAVAIDGQDNIVIAGEFGGTMDLGGETLTGAGLKDVYVAKFTGAGGLLWSRSAGDADQQYAHAVAVDGAGNIALMGDFKGSIHLGGDALVSAGLRDLFVARLAPTGEHLWSARFGDEREQHAEGAVIDGLGNVVVTGWFEGTMNLGGDDLVSQGATDIFVAKFTSAGAHLWSRRAGDDSYQVSLGVALDAQADVVITGDFGGTMTLGDDDLVSQGIFDGFLAKLGG